MRSKFFILIILLSFCLPFTYGGCGGSGGGSSGNDGGEDDGNIGTGWVTIHEDSAFTTEYESTYLSGEAFISSTGCCTGSAITDTGVTVTYTNADTGISRRAFQLAEYCWFFRWYVCGHIWSASVALQMGENNITITATDGYNEGKDSVKVTRIPETILPIPPTVSSTNPNNNAANVPTNTTITATFSEEMDASTIDSDSFTLIDNTGNPIIGSVAYQDKIATFTPSTDLDYSTTYRAVISDNVQDLSGNHMTSNYWWDFSTGPAPDTTPPTVTLEYPPNMSACIDIDTSVTATFSEVLDPTTIDSNSITLLNEGGTSIDGSVSYSRNVVIFKPYSYLSYSGKYIATITGTVTDLSGNSMGTDYTWSFFTVSSGSGSWQPISDANAPSVRSVYTSVWTGTEMLVWGGVEKGNYLNTGGKYDPVSDTWQAISATNAPSGRYYNTGVWAENEMIVWGGWKDDFVPVNTGGRYNPVTDTWRPVSIEGAPSQRRWHSAIWTGTEMIIWGGYDDDTQSVLNSGAKYDPVTDTWQPISITNAPSDRRSHTAVWTGTEMIVWGGSNNYVRFSSGGRYDPVTDSWKPTANAPGGKMYHTAVWTGNEMIVWSGSEFDNLGYKYNPVTDTWREISTLCPPEGRWLHTALWTGTEMLVWGGTGQGTGGRYNPNADSWDPINILGAPQGGDPAVWTGYEMIVWGREGGGRYEP